MIYTLQLTGGSVVAMSIYQWCFSLQVAIVEAITNGFHACLVLLRFLELIYRAWLMHRVLGGDVKGLILCVFPWKAASSDTASLN